MMPFPDMAKSNPRHDTGGKVKLALKAGIKGTAKFGGKNNEYRYRLTRTWDSAKPFALFVLMNPSNADVPDNDRHIIEMAKKATIVVFAYGKPRHKALRARGKELARLLIEKAHVNPNILSLGKDGTPKHPLYLKKTSKPVEWNL
jgi:hypothetical protein